MRDAETLDGIVMKAILACPHEIDAGSIILKVDPSRSGINALAQLRQRLIEALARAEVDRINFDSIMKFLEAMQVELDGLKAEPGR